MMKISKVILNGGVEKLLFAKYSVKTNIAEEGEIKNRRLYHMLNSFRSDTEDKEKRYILFSDSELERFKRIISELGATCEVKNIYPTSETIYRANCLINKGIPVNVIEEYAKSGKLPQVGDLQTLPKKINHVHSPYFASHEDHHLEADASSMSVRVVLPGGLKSQVLLVVKVDSTSNLVFVDAGDNKNINGKKEYKLEKQYDLIKVARVDLNSWRII